MAKRFFDTAIFDDEWFFELTKDGKLFWIYFLSKCDNAGLLKLNTKLAKFQTGVNSIDTVLIELGNRLVRVSEQLYFCPKFISFQYPKFPQSNAPQEKQVIELLQKNGLWDFEKNNFRDSVDTLSIDLSKSYGNGKGKGNGNGEENKGVEKNFSEPEIEVADNVQHPYLEKIKTDYPVLLKIDEPLTQAQAEKLEIDIGDSLVYEKMEAMANRKDLLKKYKSVNLTIRTWSKLNGKNGKTTTGTEPKERKVGRVPESGIRSIFEGEIPIIFKRNSGNGGNDG